jgi:hypothetical protein
VSEAVHGGEWVLEVSTAAGRSATGRDEDGARRDGAGRDEAGRDGAGRDEVERLRPAERKASVVVVAPTSL